MTMTIASAFNEIAVAQGGAASKTGSIAGAIDALNDALAGSDQQGAETIEDAVRLLGDHIGGGSVSGTIEITENGEGIDVAQYAYADVNVSGGSSDFTTCTVVLTSNEDFVPVVASFVASDMLIAGTTGFPPGTYTVPLYKGLCGWTVEDASDISNYSATGNATIDSENSSIMITGDCTISYGTK